MKEVRTYGPPDAIVYLIGHKSDLSETRQVSVEEGMELAERLEIVYLEASSLDDVNIKDAYLALIKDIL